jgi:hypothetical protein
MKTGLGRSRFRIFTKPPAALSVGKDFLQCIQLCSQKAPDVVYELKDKLVYFLHDFAIMQERPGPRLRSEGYPREVRATGLKYDGLKDPLFNYPKRLSSR